MANKYEFHKLYSNNNLFIFSPRKEKVLVVRQYSTGKVESALMDRTAAKALWSDLECMGFRRQADSSQPVPECIC